jgi:hypothetical protein
VLEARGTEVIGSHTFAYLGRRSPDWRREPRTQVQEIPTYPGQLTNRLFGLNEAVHRSKNRAALLVLDEMLVTRDSLGRLIATLRSLA